MKYPIHLDKNKKNNKRICLLPPIYRHRNDYFKLISIVTTTPSPATTTIPIIITPKFHRYYTTIHTPCQYPF